MARFFIPKFLDGQRPSSDHPIRMVELFAGIGAPRKALTNLGIPHTSVVSEIDRHAIACYNAIHGETENLGDIREIGRLPPCDIMISGSPCQSISMEGKRTGMVRGSGTESSLTWEEIRILGNTESCHLPRFIIKENVEAITHKRNERDLKQLIREYARLGYTFSQSVLDASDWGLPQRRRRWFAVFSRDGTVFRFPRFAGHRSQLNDIMEGNVELRYFLPWERIETFISERHQADVRDALAIRDNNRKGYQLAYYGDGVTVNRPTSTCKRGRVQAGRLSALVCANDVQTVVDRLDGKLWLRYITPLEGFRAQGFDDRDCLNCMNVSGEPSLYDRIGNTMPVPVIQAIIKAMLTETHPRSNLITDYARSCERPRGAV